MRSKETLIEEITNRLRKSEDTVSVLKTMVGILEHDLKCLHNDCKEGLDVLKLKEPSGPGIYSGTPKEKPPTD